MVEWRRNGSRRPARTGREPGARPAGRAVGPFAAARAVARCVAVSVLLLARRRVHLPVGRVGTRVRLPDGTSSRVYRETVLDGVAVTEPCALVVAFRLRAVRGRGHALFRWESLLNTPLFVGFPGFVSKLWLAHDQRGVYRGLYDWDGVAAAEHYARSLWWVLALVSVPGSIHHTVLPGAHRDDLLDQPEAIQRCGGDGSEVGGGIPDPATGPRDGGCGT
jgi:hypothetical protein